MLDESTRERVGDRAAAGLWTAFGYYQQLPTAENRAFLARYRNTFGPWAPPVSTLSESIYSALHLYGTAVRRAAAAGRRRWPHQIRQQLRLAEASVGGFRLLDSAS